MSEPLLDLLGDPMPEPLPENIQLRDVKELVGHTIRAVFNESSGEYPCLLAIITTTNCWIAFDGESDSYDGDSVSLSVIQPYGAEPLKINHFVAAWELHQEDCINDIELKALNAEQDLREKAKKLAQAARMRAEADLIVKGL